MTPTQQFIEDMLAGGYMTDLAEFIRKLPEYAYSQLLLDPLAWQATYRTRLETTDEETIASVARTHAHNFLDFRFDGKTVDEALASI